MNFGFFGFNVLDFWEVWHRASEPWVVLQVQLSRAYTNDRGGSKCQAREDDAASVYGYTGTLCEHTIRELVAWPGRRMRRVCTVHRRPMSEQSGNCCRKPCHLLQHSGGAARGVGRGDCARQVVAFQRHHAQPRHVAQLGGQRPVCTTVGGAGGVRHDTLRG